MVNKEELDAELVNKQTYTYMYKKYCHSLVVNTIILSLVINTALLSLVVNTVRLSLAGDTVFYLLTLFLQSPKSQSQTIDETGSKSSTKNPQQVCLNKFL